MNNFIKNQDGFSFLEILLAITIFSIVMVSSSMIFQQVVVGQQREVAAQNAQESMRFMMEVISKEMRMAKRFTTGGGDACENRVGFDFLANGGIANRLFQISDDQDFSSIGYASTSEEIYFKNEHDECVHYYLSGGNFMVNRIKEDDASDVESGEMNPSNLIIKKLSFKIKGSDDYSTLPLVTVLFDVESGSGLSKDLLKVQTTIAPRYYPE